MFYRENGQFKTSYRADQQIFPILQDRVAIGALLVVAFLVVPFFASNYMFSAILIPVVILSLAALGTNILIGYCGQISLGSGAFMAVGAYGAYNLIMRVPGTPLIVALLMGGVFAALFGVVFGLPSLRVKGLYLAVTTLAAQFFADWMFYRVKWLTMDSPSISVTAPDLSFFGLSLESYAAKYLFCLLLLAVLALACKNLVRSAIGREWMAIRDMDVAAAVIGIRPVYAKLTAFAVSSFIIGIAGALWGFFYLGSWEPAAFGLEMSLELLFMIIIGGLGSIMGNFIGAAFMVVLPILIRRGLPMLGDLVGLPLGTAAAAHLELMLFGVLIVWFLIVESHGLARLWSTGKQKLRLWPFPH
ncbi:MAG TPA: branched-chain amino acid ABC transporter permease [Ottowia sp.]|uniref:branched-chain amino acid ABC transporter permease n=1 Tax=Ottowia sp. TaxID=1898956 RepID=UPI002C406CBD|nr:branched-chain amino acid ABC transporter permease [Ottowia sp.]HMN21362.1 branched-chain amino acid ABC transporter permease [Ottowia sp.]